MNQPKNTNENATIMQDTTKYKIRSAVDALKDAQNLRIATGNRICASFKRGLSDDKEVDKVTKALVGEFQRVADVYAEKFKSKGKIDKAIQATDGLTLIKDRFDYQLVESYASLLETEKLCKENVEFIVKQHPMWAEFFKDVKGCGPLIAAMCIAYLDVHKARHVSSFWSYAGIGTRLNEEGERVAMTPRALVDQTYINKDGQEATKKSLGYNPTLQSYLLGVFVPSVLKTAKGSHYNTCYYDYKNRYRNREDLAEASDLRIHRMATRQVAKAMLRDLWVAWRSYEGYELSRPYEVEYLGRAPHMYNEAHTRKATL